MQPEQSRMIGRRGVLGLSASVLLATGTARAEDAAQGDAVAIVRAADTARGGGLPGIAWNIHLVTTGTDGPNDGERDMQVQAITSASVAETLTPVRFRGTKLLQVDRNMWLTRPGLQKPVPISPRQRLSGLAANGDIAATNYASDYNATLLRQEPVGGEPCHALDLVAKTQFATYDRILYWVSVQRGVAVRAQFLAVSGKLLKSATFDYANTIPFNGRTIAFVSRMTIADALTPAQTDMRYSNVSVQTIPTGVFSVGTL